MPERLIVPFDIIIVFLGVFISLYSVKLIRCLKTGFNSGWWSLLPTIFIYATFNRFLILLLALDIIPNTAFNLNLVSALNIVFWVGAAIFVYGLYRTATKLLCNGR